MYSDWISLGVFLIPIAKKICWTIFAYGAFTVLDILISSDLRLVGTIAEKGIN